MSKCLDRATRQKRGQREKKKGERERERRKREREREKEGGSSSSSTRVVSCCVVCVRSAYLYFIVLLLFLSLFVSLFFSSRVGLSYMFSGLVDTK